MHDSYLTAESIQAESGLNTDIETACQNPSAFYESSAKCGNYWHFSSPEVVLDWNSEDSNLLVITYNFEAPESSIGAEQRIVDINPIFLSVL